MRTSPARLLILIALLLVILVEARTVLAFFDVDVSLGTVAIVGVLAIAALLVWATRPADDDDPDR